MIIGLPYGQGQLSRIWKRGKGMLSSVEQAFVGREEIRAPLKTPAWEDIQYVVSIGFSLQEKARSGWHPIKCHHL